MFCFAALTPSTKSMLVICWLKPSQQNDIDPGVIFANAIATFQENGRYRMGISRTKRNAFLPKPDSLSSPPSAKGISLIPVLNTVKYAPDENARCRSTPARSDILLLGPGTLGAISLEEEKTEKAEQQLQRNENQGAAAQPVVNVADGPTRRYIMMLSN